MDEMHVPNDLHALMQQKAWTLWQGKWWTLDGQKWIAKQEPWQATLVSKKKATLVSHANVVKFAKSQHRMHPTRRAILERNGIL